MFRYIASLLSVSIVFFNFNPAIANTIVPRPIYPINPINPIYPLYPANNTYPTYYSDYSDYSDYDNIYNYKLFEIKNNKFGGLDRLGSLGIVDTIKNSFRSLYYPFEGKLPLYARMYKNSS